MTDNQGVTSTPPAQVVATVTGNDLLSRLDSHAGTLARIEQSVNAIPGELATLRDHDARTIERVAVLERWRAFWIGVTSVVTLLLTSGVVAALLAAVRR